MGKIYWLIDLANGECASRASQFYCKVLIYSVGEFIYTLFVLMISTMI